MQKIGGNLYIEGARGQNQFHFCNWLGTRGIGGYTLVLYLQYFLYDIS